MIGVDTDISGFEHLNSEFTKVSEPTNEEWIEKELQYEQMLQDEDYSNVMLNCKKHWDENSLSFNPNDVVTITPIEDETI